MTALLAVLQGWYASPAAAPSQPVAPLPSVPVLTPGSMAVPPWLAVVGYVLAGLGTLGLGGVVVKLLERRKTRAEAGRTEAEAGRTEADANEVMTRVAVTLVEPLRERLEASGQQLEEAIERNERDRAVWEERNRRDRERADAEIAALRAKVREALGEADGALDQAHRIRRLLQQWHRAIMDPAATIEWLRQLVGPDEPSL